MFVAAIFNACPGLEEEDLAEEEIEEIKASMIDKDGDPREERAFKMWINSLGIEGVNIASLYNELSDGLYFLKILEKIASGSVNWKMAEMKPKKNKFKALANCNLAVKTAK